MSNPLPFDSWLKPDAHGLYCAPGDFYIDPHAAVARAIVTHGHSDHARPGHEAVLATDDTLNIMRFRLGSGAGGNLQAAAYGQSLRIGDVTVPYLPPRHKPCSARGTLASNGHTAANTGDEQRYPAPPW